MKDEPTRLWERFSRLFRQHPQALTWLEQRLEDLEGLLHRPDLTTKVAIYEHAAAALVGHCGTQRGETLEWLLGRLEEPDLALRGYLARLQPPSAAAAAKLDDALVGLQVTFRRDPLDRKTWRRLVEVYLRAGEVVRCRKSDEVVDWSELPEEVRTPNLSSGQTEFDFSLLPPSRRRPS